MIQEYRWQPAAEFDRLFDSFISHRKKAVSPAIDWIPAVDVQESDDSYTIIAELPGVEKEDISVSVKDDSLVISGSRSHRKVSDSTVVHKVERSFGKFRRVFSLPKAIDAEKIQANYQSGILTVTVAKKDEVKPKAIDIQVA